jgi:hypothetical protein
VRRQSARQHPATRRRLAVPDPDDADHLISADELFNLAMAKQ